MTAVENAISDVILESPISAQLGSYLANVQKELAQSKQGWLGSMVVREIVS